MDMILASGSPRRRELLTMLGLAFTVVPPDEELAPQGLTPGETVTEIARGKARSVAEKLGALESADSNKLVLAADTLVYFDGAPLGKPRGAADAVRMLRALSGRAHEVYT
ncbi:MAG: Maf family protein, partial [Oscillospiraceae bacterium]|nr:Maf family protein [Oscillospiraceae bacterium]